MPDRLYTLLVADRSSGVVRRITFKRGPVLAIILTAVGVPVLIGLGARWSASSEIEHLRLANAALAVENNSYREATTELTSQIQSLEGVVNQLGVRGSLDAHPARQPLRADPPPIRATSGAIPALSNVFSTFSSPDDTFGALRELLHGLENRLRFARGETTTPPK